jgi:AAA domain
MPEVNRDKFLSPTGITAWINGAAGSGKTRLAMGFPDVLAITFDPTGLDVLKEPENVKLLDNLRWHVPLNGIELSRVFQFSEVAGEDGIYPAIALARKLGPRGERKIKTVVLDGFTYLAQLKWTQICQAKGVDPTEKQNMDRKESDQRSWYDALGSYLDHMVLQNLLPLATRDDLNVIVTCHVQRESDNTVKGIQVVRSVTAQEQQASSKRQVNLDSDLSPQVLGSFRQRIDGLPSATIYLEHKLIQASEADVQRKLAAAVGQEILKYYAYCRMARSESLDTVIKSKNRFGLGTLDLTNGSFFKTLLKKIGDSRSAAQSKPESTTTKSQSTK